MVKTERTGGLLERHVDPCTQSVQTAAATGQAIYNKLFWQSRARNAHNLWQFNFPDILQSQKRNVEDRVLGWAGVLEIPDSACASPKEVCGVTIASSGLMEAILKYRSFSSYHFLDGMSWRNANRSDDEIKNYLYSLGVDPLRVAAFYAVDNTHYLNRVEYHAVHKPGPDLPYLSRLRRSIRGSPFPITGMTHTISYGDMMPMWLELLLADLLPCDTLVCTSRVARKTIETIFAELSDRLSRRVNCKKLTFKGQLEVIPLGVDSDYWRPNCDKSEARSVLGLPQKQCIILSAGRFSVHDKMDLAPFLIAIRRLVDKYQDQRFQVILAGDMPSDRWNYAARVRVLIHELGLTQIVRLETTLAPAVMKLLFEGADIFVSLSDNVQETFGLTILQAMACGLPALVSDWNGYKDTVVHEETGFRARTLWTRCEKHISDLSFCRRRYTNHLYLAQTVAVDLDQVVGYLDALITNPDLRTKLGNAARKRVEQQFAWPLVVKQYEHLWDDCRVAIQRMNQTELSQADASDVFNPSYFSRFSHYASKLLQDNSVLTVTDIGFELMSESSILNTIVCCDEMRYVLCAPVFTQIARRMEQATMVNMGELLRCTVEALPVPVELVVRHIMWLIKYGALRVVDPVG